MKPIIKYISLLLFSGLILPFYISSKTPMPAVKVIAATNTPRPLNFAVAHCFIYQVIADIYFPELKK